MLLSTLYPPLAPLLWVHAVLVERSLIVPGLHFPSDVVVGAFSGMSTASLVLVAS
jgi:membrane-associated phospholipid phosphatase